MKNEEFPVGVLPTGAANPKDALVAEESTKDISVDVVKKGSDGAWYEQVSKCVPVHIYEMSFDQFVTSGRATKYTKHDVDNEVATDIRLHVTVHYRLAMLQMHSVSGVKKRDIWSFAMRLGAAIWSHESDNLLKDMCKMRTKLYDDDYEKCCALFGVGDRKAPYTGDRIDVNARVSINEVAAQITNNAECLGISTSMLGIAILALGMLQWEGIAPAARKVMEQDVAEIRKRRDDIATACGISLI